MKKLIRNIFLIGLTATLCIAAWCQLEKNKEKIEADARLAGQRNNVIPVVTTVARWDTLDNRFDVVGNLAPYKMVTVMSEAAGKVTRILFDNGSFVRQGATLLSIDKDLLRIQLKTTKTNLAKANNDLRRLTNLLGDGGATSQQVEEAQLAVDNLQLQIQSIKKQMAMRLVKAPISGIISQKKVEKGSLVSPAMPIARITNISRLKLQVYLTEHQVTTIKKGDRIAITPDTAPDEKTIGNISFIDVNTGPGKKYLVEIELPNPDNRFRAGMTATAHFTGNKTKKVLAIPRKSIVGDLRNAKVFVVHSNTARLKSIQTGTVFHNKVQITKGLTPGDTIVVAGQINLEDGSVVN